MPARPDSLPAAGWKGSKGHPPCACFASGPLLESSDERAAFRVANRATARFVLRTGGAGSKGLRHSAIHPENRQCRFEGSSATCACSASGPLSSIPPDEPSRVKGLAPQLDSKYPRQTCPPQSAQVFTKFRTASTSSVPVLYQRTAVSAATLRYIRMETKL